MIYAHSDFVYVNLHLDKYDVRTFKPKDERRDKESIFYGESFDLYGSCSNSAENNTLYLMDFVKIMKNGKGNAFKKQRELLWLNFLLKVVIIVHDIIIRIASTC